MGFVDPNLVQNPSSGNVIQSAFGDVLRDDVYALYGAPTSRALRATNQTVNDATVTGIAADTLHYDTHVIHSVVGGVSRFTVPADWGGSWDVGMSVNWQSNGNGFRKIWATINGAQIAGQVVQMGWGGECEQSLHTSWIAVAGDYFEFWAYQQSGVALNLEPLVYSAQAIWAEWRRGPMAVAG